MPENLYPKLPSAPLISQKSFNFETIRKYHQDITDLKNKYHEEQKCLYTKLCIIGGISTTGTAFTVVQILISASLGAVSTVSACASGILLVTSKKYKNKLLKCYELLDKSTISLRF